MHNDCDITVNIYDEQNSCIVREGLDNIVKRITAAELPDSFEIEAVKAMAVAVRTTVVKTLKMFDGIGCDKYRGADICTGTKGYRCITNTDLLKKSLGDRFELYYNLACKAAEETSGIIMTFGRRPVSARFHSTCGGGTENSEDVLGNRVMYFRKVLCSYCTASPSWENTVDIPVEELERKLNIKMERGSSIFGPQVEGSIDSIERDETGRVRKIRIGGKSFTGIEVKNLLGLSSSRFGWDPAVIRFRVRGTGDGLGMCLYGANGMAGEGKGYMDILKYYYTGVDVEPFDLIGEGVPLKGKVFVLDPGHGGIDSDDEKGPSGLREKDVNIYVVKKLAQYLEKDGARVILTREDDEQVSLQARVEMVNNIRPNFLISIHHNAFFSPGVSGTEVYCYRGDFEGERISRTILDNIVKAMGTINRGCKYADLYILRGSKVSSIVVECMYITNPAEEKRLMDDSTRDDMARAIYRGILDYYGI